MHSSSIAWGLSLLSIVFCFFFSTSTSTSDMDKDSDEEFFDAEMEGEWSMGGGMASSSHPSVSVPVAEGDPPEVEEDGDYEEADDTSGLPQHPQDEIKGIPALFFPSLSLSLSPYRWSAGKQKCDNAHAITDSCRNGPDQNSPPNIHFGEAFTAGDVCRAFCPS